MFLVCFPFTNAQRILLIHHPLTESRSAFLLSALAAELGSSLSTRCRERAVRKSRFPLSDAQVFRRVLIHFVMSTLEPSVPASLISSETTELPNNPPRLKKIPPYWYPYTTMAKGRWLGREILEVVSTEFRDRSMEFYVRISFNPSFGLSLNGMCGERRVQYMIVLNANVHLVSSIIPSLRVSTRQSLMLHWEAAFRHPFSTFADVNGATEVCTTIGRDDDQRKSGKARHYYPEWRQDRVRALSLLTDRRSDTRYRNVSHRHEPPVTSTPVRIVLHDKERGFIAIDKPGSIVRHPCAFMTLP